MSSLFITKIAVFVLLRRQKVLKTGSHFSFFLRFLFSDVKNFILQVKCNYFSDKCSFVERLCAVLELT